uniref:Proteasome 20S subunit alpha 5 n=2 Tax=Neognathae TaxID=8825 RepID=A0A8B9DUL6_ANSCY
MPGPLLAAAFRTLGGPTELSLPNMSREERETSQMATLPTIWVMAAREPSQGLISSSRAPCSEQGAASCCRLLRGLLQSPQRGASQPSPQQGPTPSPPRGLAAPPGRPRMRPRELIRTWGGWEAWEMPAARPSQRAPLERERCRPAPRQRRFPPLLPAPRRAAASRGAPRGLREVGGGQSALQVGEELTRAFPLLPGCAMSGLIADAKTLIDKARVETQNHWFTYNETMTVESVTQAVSNLALQFGEEDADPGAMSRPFGVALLFGGVDEKGPQLFHMDPSGTFVQCDARAIGSASEGAQSSLQEVYHKSMTLKEAIKSSLVILKQVMEEKLNATNIELATVEPGMKFHMYTKEELEEVIKDI